MQSGWEIGQDVQSVAATEFQYNYHDIIERTGDRIEWAGVFRPLRVLQYLTSRSRFKCAGNA
jgi:hypothetical protein